MKHSLDLLPARKQAQLRAIVDIIRELAEVELIILFGSYARGGWQEDPASGYVSDFDLLILVANERVAKNHKLWTTAEDRAERITDGVPVTIIAHTVKYVNKQLARGWYFFTDIYQEGIVLHDSYRTRLAEPAEMTRAQRRQFAQECLDDYLGQGDRFYKGFGFYLQESDYKEAAFLLHQATESYYKAVSLVFTAYRPKQHNLDKLSKRCGNLHPALRDIFPMDTPEARARFALLKAAYVDARYSRKYSITHQDLDILAGHVRELRARTERACGEHIATLAADSARADDMSPDR